MLPKQFRLPARMIPLVAYKGRKLVGKYMDVRYLADASATKTLIAITVTTKASKNAVVRNRIRRQLTVAVSELATAGKLPSGKYIILVRSPEIITANANPAQELRNTLSLV